MNVAIGSFVAAGTGDWQGTIALVGSSEYVIDNVAANDVLFDENGKKFVVLVKSVIVAGYSVLIDVDELDAAGRPLSGRGALMRPTANMELLLPPANGSNFFSEETESKMLIDNFIEIDAAGGGIPGTPGGDGDLTIWDAGELGSITKDQYVWIQGLSYGRGLAGRMTYFVNDSTIEETIITYSSTLMNASSITGALGLPTGTTAERGAATLGFFRANSTLGDIEFGNGTIYRSVVESMFGTGTSGEIAYFNTAGVLSDTTPAGILSMIAGLSGTGVAPRIPVYDGTSTFTNYANFLYSGTSLSVATTNSTYPLEVGTGGMRFAPQSADPPGTGGVKFFDSDDNWFKGYNGTQFWFFARSDDVDPGTERIWFQNTSNTAMSSSSSLLWSANDNDGLVIGGSDAGANGLNVRRLGSSGDIAAFESDAGTDMLSIEGTGIIDFEQGISGGAGLRWGTSGQTLFGVSGQGIQASFTNSGGNKSMEFNVTATGDMACIGGNTIGGNPSQTGVFALTTFGGTTTSSTVTFRGADAGGAQTFGGAAIVRGGTGSTANSDGGNLTLRGGGQTGTWFAGGGIPGDVIIEMYNDFPDSASHVAGYNTPVEVMRWNQGPRYQWVSKQRMSVLAGYTVTEELVMHNDTIKMSPKSYGEMHIQDTSPGTVAITAGSPVECSGWASLVATNFTFAAGRLTYTGTETARFLLDASMSVTHDVSGSQVKAWLYYNNSKQQKTGSYTEIPTAGTYHVVNPKGTLILATNDYIEIFLDSDATGNVDVIQANLTITKL